MVLVAVAAFVGLFGSRASRKAGPPIVRPTPQLAPPTPRLGGADRGPAAGVERDESSSAPQVLAVDCRRVAVGGDDTLRVSADVSPGPLARVRVVARMRYAVGGRERTLSLGERETTRSWADRDGREPLSYVWSVKLSGDRADPSAVHVVVYDATNDVRASRTVPLSRNPDE